MSSATINTPQRLKAGEALHGFRIRRVRQLPDIRVTAYEAQHEPTGATVLHLHCNDRENLFAIGFRTPPPDSTGVPHILEHAVLAGSERYPLKDVFNELIRGSLQTFLNAFTYPDKTLYPAASQVRSDFFNLARVYTDLVLKPRLLKETFAQEGHHLELLDPQNPDAELTRSGIVYNEMKGAYSSPDSLMYKAIQEGLYPGTVYARDSGGNPDEIPKLTHEQLKAFHHAYYSPSNARFFLYGDITTRDHLAFLEEILAGFPRIAVASAIGKQRRWKSPRTMRGVFPVGREENLKKKSAVNMAWMLTENRDHETAVLLEILAGILIGTAAGPLRKALIDSGLGEDLSPVTGLERDLRQIAFVVGLRGTDADQADHIQEVILQTLAQCAQKGFESDLIEGTLHQVEFHGREIVRKAMPYGITLMSRVYHTWLYGGDPLAGLNFPKTIAGIRKKWHETPRLFQDLLQAWLLDNPHRLLSIMKPSRTYQEEREEAFKKKMQHLKASLSRDQIDSIRRESAVLKKFQTEPDPPEASASLPQLQVKELSRSVETTPSAWSSIAEATTMIHDLFTNGIVYVDLAFDVSHVPENLQPYLPLLGKLTLNMGAAGRGYEEMAKRIALKTGGLACSLSSGLRADGQGHWEQMIFSVKALFRNVPDAIDLVSDMLISGDLTHQTRMRDMILEKKNRLQASVIPSGHSFAKMAAGSAFSVPAYRDEQWHGRKQLRFLADVADRYTSEKEELADSLHRLRRLVYAKGRLFINITADQPGVSLTVERLTSLIRGLLPGSPGSPGRPDLRPVHMGVSIPAEVCYVAKALPAPPYEDPAAPALFVLARYLSSVYLYNHIRVQGGAYGGMSQYDPLNGLFSLLSYRDPHIVQTLGTYEKAIDLLSEESLDADDVRKAVIGTIGGLDKPMDPASRGYTAMIRHFSGLSDEYRQQFRLRILETTPEGLHEKACPYFTGAGKQAAIAVYASDENLRWANEILVNPLAIETLL